MFSVFFIFVLHYISIFSFFFFFFFNDTATTEIYTLSLHDALPIYSLLAETKTVPNCPSCTVFLTIGQTIESTSISHRDDRQVKSEVLIDLPSQFSRPDCSICRQPHRQQSDTLLSSSCSLYRVLLGRQEKCMRMLHGLVARFLSLSNISIKGSLKSTDDCLTIPEVSELVSHVESLTAARRKVRTVRLRKLAVKLK